MKTEDLITRLAAEAPATAPISGGRVVMAGLLAGLPALALLLGLLGMRPDFMAAMAVPVTTLKMVLPAAIALLAGGAALRLMRPEGRVGLAGPALAGLALVALALVVWRLVVLSAPQIPVALMGRTAPQCLFLLLGLATGPFLAVFWGLRAGASTRPALTGGLAGLAAGGAAATLYALHCPEDDPLFFVFWYGGAILLSGLAGMVAGARGLRW